MKKCPVIGLNMSMSAPDTFALATNYSDAIEQAGGLPIFLPAYGRREQIQAALAMLDGFLFSGGKDYFPSHYGGKKQPAAELMEKRRDSFDMLLAEIVLRKTELPVLGICGGAQLINIVRGGALVQDIAIDWQLLTEQKPLQHQAAAWHSITVERHSLLFEITKKEEMLINSYHHQAIHPQRLGERLMVTARSSDKIVEAIEHCPQTPQDERFILGVQWHPERMFCKDALQKLIFSAFIRAALAHRVKRSDAGEAI